MNQKYNSWLEKTKTVEGTWTIDPMMEANRVYLFYKGTNKYGVFIEFNADCEVIYGTYTGAAPTIWDADFKKSGRKFAEGATNIGPFAIKLFRDQGADHLLRYLSVNLR